LTMKLSPENAELFYRLMWQLQFTVNERLGILSKANTLEKYSRLASEDKLKVRAALWEHPELIDAFVAANPGGLSGDELAIVESWKRFVAGEFFIERFLKKGAVFVGGHEPPNVYLVVALLQSFEEILPRYGAPYYVRATLLPFRDQIIYDGLLEPYNMIFGAGVRGSLREDYLRAKQRGEIITSLLPAEGPRPGEEPAGALAEPTRISPDVQSAVGEIATTAGKLKAADSPVASAALALLRASAHLAQAAVSDPQDLTALWEHEAKTRRALIRLERALERDG
jgi:hypothetical protein